jgi:enediyne biosynthesis protein E4
MKLVDMLPAILTCATLAAAGWPTKQGTPRSSSLAWSDQTMQLPLNSQAIVAAGHFHAAVEGDEEPSSRPASLSFSDIWAGPSLNGGHGAMWADVDGDSLPDLYLPLIFSDTLPDLLLHNKGNGRFAEEGAQRGIADPDGGSHGAAWCDLDNDGDYDLINGTTFDDGSGIHNNVLRNDGNGRFREVKPAALESRQEETRAFISFDMDRDGDLDLFGVSNYQGSADPPDERNEVYRNDGNFKFASITGGDLVTAPAGQGATDTDFDGDGDIDVLAANRTGPVNILRNDGRGNFTLTDPASIGIRHPAEDGVTSADVDNDGDLDLLLTSSGGRGHLYRNDGSSRFVHAQSFSEPAGYMGGFADLDNDRDLDLYFAGDAKIFLNDGGGNFSPGPAVPVAGKNDPRGVAFADIDNDGDLDFAFGDKRANRNYILRNNLQGGGNWLKIRLIAANGQAGAFGAKTLMYPAGQAGGPLLAMRESQSNCGYLGQNDPVLHFGLGQRTHVDVVVKFLDGTAVTKTRVLANQTLLINAAAPER